MNADHMVSESFETHAFAPPSTPSRRGDILGETTTLSIGNASDVVYVLRTDDGAAVFRRYLPRYSRSEVVFFDDGFFGYSDLEGTHILKIPTQ